MSTTSETTDLRRQLAEALLADIKRAAMPLQLLPGQIGHLGARTHYDLADAVLEVVQPLLDQHAAGLAAERARTGQRRRATYGAVAEAAHYRARWESTVVEARRQAARADSLEQQAELSAWNTVRLGEKNAKLRAELADAGRMRDFHARSAGHVARKRDRAEQLISRYRDGHIGAEDAIDRIARALSAEGDDAPPPPAAPSATT